MNSHYISAGFPGRVGGLPRLSVRSAVRTACDLQSNCSMLRKNRAPLH